MEQLSQDQRAAALRHMAETGVDILVIGGGITGAGVALDAAARGYSVGLVERADFASGTSSRSTKLVHGGIRYLPQFDFALVHEGLVERGLLGRNAPFLMQPLGFVLPLYADAKRPLGTPIVPPFGIGMSYLLQSGLLLYDLMAGRLGLRRHRRLSLARAEQLVPCLKMEGLKDAFIFYDGQTDDSRLTATVIRTAAQHGALIANYAEVTGFDQQDGHIVAAQVRDRQTGTMLTIRAGTVINAGGVFAGKVEALTGGQSQVHIKPAKGVHITVSRAKLRMGKDALAFPETEDGRILFVVPWGPRVTIGTTDTPGGDLEHPEAAPADIAYLLRHVNRYMSCGLTEDDIISSWAGYRPLVSSADPNEPSAKLSRTHVVLDSPGGMVTITGGKLTSFRRMAQDTVDHVSKRLGRPIKHATEQLRLAGTDNWQEVAASVNQKASRYGLRDDTVRRLERYGNAAATMLDLLAADPGLNERIVPDLPYIMAEVVFACRYELALRVEDVLTRRLHISFEDWHQGVGCAPRVAQVMARELGWDADEIARQVEQYRQYAGQFRAGLPAQTRPQSPQEVARP